MNIIQQAADDIKGRRPFAICTVVSTRGSTPRSSATKMLVYESGEIHGTIGGGTIEFEVIKAAVDSLVTGEATLYSASLGRDLAMCCGGEMKVFIEPFTTKQTVHLFGAGHVSKALASLLPALNFQTVVYDEREDLLNLENFPTAKHVLGDANKALLDVGGSLCADDAVVIFTHLHDLDYSLLSNGLEKNWGYMGLIGSSTKIKRFELRLKSSEKINMERWPDVSAPIGIEIGSKSPAEIAVSIAAELIAWRAGS